MRIDLLSVLSISLLSSSHLVLQHSSLLSILILLSLLHIILVACNLIPEGDIPADAPEQLDLFTDYAALEKKKAAEDAADEKERRLQKTALLLQQKYGKNAIVKGMNLQKGATTILRNGQIGGHDAGDDGRVHHNDGHQRHHAAQSGHEDSEPQEQHSEEDGLWQKE